MPLRPIGSPDYGIPRMWVDRHGVRIDIVRASVARMRAAIRLPSMAAAALNRCVPVTRPLGVSPIDPVQAEPRDAVQPPHEAGRVYRPITYQEYPVNVRTQHRRAPRSGGAVGRHNPTRALGLMLAVALFAAMIGSFATSLQSATAAGDS